MPVDDPSSASPPLSDPSTPASSTPAPSTPASSTPARRVVVSASWRDHSITAIAAEAARRGELDARYIVDDRFVAGLALLKGGFGPAARAHATRARERSARQTAPGDVRVGRRPELMRVLGAVTDARTGWELGERRWKTTFDRAVARRVRRRPLTGHDVVVGLPGSSLRTFEVAGPAARVFNAIDAHPREHNRVLEEAYGRDAATAEIYPDALVARIEAELALADVVLVPSRATAEGMVRHGVAEAKVRVLPYAVSLQDFGLDPGAAAPAHPPAARPQVLFVGQVCYRKGIPSLLEAARRAPGVDVRLAGPVFQPHLVADLPGNVTVLGTLDPDTLRGEYRAADAFVLPTLDDTFGFVVTEAAAAGLPLILSPHCGAREVVAALPATRTVDPLAPDGVAALAAALAEVAPLSWEERLGHARAFRDLDRPHPDWAHYGAAVLDSVTTGVTR